MISTFVPVILFAETKHVARVPFMRRFVLPSRESVPRNRVRPSITRPNNNITSPQPRFTFKPRECAAYIVPPRVLAPYAQSSRLSRLNSPPIGIRMSTPWLLQAFPGRGCCYQRRDCSEHLGPTSNRSSVPAAGQEKTWVIYIKCLRLAAQASTYCRNVPSLRRCGAQKPRPNGRPSSSRRNWTYHARD